MRIIIGIGHFNTESAIAVSAAHWLRTENKSEHTHKVMFNGEASISEEGQETVVRVGIGIEF